MGSKECRMDAHLKSNCYGEIVQSLAAGIEGFALDQSLIRLGGQPFRAGALKRLNQIGLGTTISAEMEGGVMVVRIRAKSWQTRA